MLKLVRKFGESVRIGSGVMTVHKKRGKAIELLFDFPDTVRIMRSEIDDGEDRMTFEHNRRVQTLKHIRSNVQKLRRYHETPMQEENLLVEQTVRLVSNLLGKDDD